MRKYLILAAMFLLTGGQGVQEAYGWGQILKSNELYAVGQFGSENSHLVKINPTGSYTYIGSTGLNNCSGLDFTPEGKLKAFCELGERAVLGARNGPEPKPGVVAELDLNDGSAKFAVPIGITNSISDITISEDGTIYSLERAGPQTLFKHLEENDFAAMEIGGTDIESPDSAMASWDPGALKVAANVDGPKLFSVSPLTGSINSTVELEFPDDSAAAANSLSQRFIPIVLFKFASMDSVRPDGRPGAQTVKARPGGYAFEETDADFAVLMYEPTGMIRDPESSVQEIDWQAIALIDTDTKSIDYIVMLPQGPPVLKALALRPIEPRPIPTMSEWSMIGASALLLLFAVYFISRGRIMKKA